MLVRLPRTPDVVFITECMQINAGVKLYELFLATRSIVRVKIGKQASDIIIQVHWRIRHAVNVAFITHPP
jgi:hypothetical protein